MSDLSRLNVSLTKHNAHKIASLLKKYEANQVLDKLHEVHADKAQARKTLSVLPGDIVPDIWEKAKALGDDAVDALVLVGIIFSHHSLIRAMSQAGSRSQFSGRIERGNQPDTKTYTNLARIIEQLGYASKDPLGVTFNLGRMFEISGFGRLVRELLALKLIKAGWNQSNDIEDEAAALRFNEVFGITASELRTWLRTGQSPTEVPAVLLAKDEDFFHLEDEGAIVSPFIFTSGHVKRAVEPLSKSPSLRTKANQLHNDIQNRLYSHLCEEFGAANVGTELDTGSGTAIDVATRNAGSITFYEIKTSSSVRASIRQAIPQLLEYAFWPSEKRADRLVIVSQLPITTSAEEYMRHLRKQFNLPIYYQQFCLEGVPREPRDGAFTRFRRIRCRYRLIHHNHPHGLPGG